MRASKDQRKHQVWKACDTLMVEGFQAEEITCDHVIDKLVELGYGKGGRSPVVRYKREWLQKQSGKSSQQDNQHTQHETHLMHLVKTILSEMYQEVEAEKYQAIQVVEDDWSDRFQNLDATYQALLSDYQSLTSKYNDAITKLSDVEKVNQQQQSDIINLNQALSSARTRAEGLEQQLLETQKGYERRVKSLEEDKQAITKERQDKEQQWRDDLNSAIEANEKARHQSMVDRDQLETRFKKTEKRAIAAETQVERLTADHKTVKRELGEQQEINKQLQVELNHQKTTLIELREMNTRQDEALKQVRDQRVELQHEHREQTSQIIALREENAALTEKLHQAQLRIQRLQAHERTALTE